MPKQLRFWSYENGPVMIKIKPGQTLHYSRGGHTDEGWYRSERKWELDPDTDMLIHRWVDDETDCDGRLTRCGTSYCRAQDVRAGYCDEDGITYPLWVEGKQSQRDYSAEAMGY